MDTHSTSLNTHRRRCSLLINNETYHICQDCLSCMLNNIGYGVIDQCLCSQWIKHVDEQGRPYYYSADGSRSEWELPKVRSTSEY